jgi:hypothetical protein
MPLFECDKCHCVENTATGSYWGQSEKLCSECKYGEWHGRFIKEPAKGMLIDNQGFLWSQSEVDNNDNHNSPIVGVVE